MPLMILGLAFAIGLFILYLLSTRNPRDKEPAEEKLKEEENVIYLPNDIEKVKSMHRKK